MRFKSGFLVGLGAGHGFKYVPTFGRYQQIVDAAGRLRENPSVQRLTGEVNKTVSAGKDRVAETAAAKADQAKETVAAKADQAKEAVSSKVGGNAGSSSTTSSSGGGL